MTNKEHVEMSIRAAQVSHSLLGILKSSSIRVARLHFVEALQQLKLLDDLMTTIETRVKEPSDE